jgi:TrbL/VirB6 plasmid conjugal transfer protein
MAEPLPRAGRSRPARRPVRALLVAAAILTVVFSGLFMSRPASAATSAPAAPSASSALAASSARTATSAPAATSARTSTSARTATSEKAVRSAETAESAQTAKAAPVVLLAAGSRNALLHPDGGVCSVPGIGDIGALAGLCNEGSSGLGGELNNICTPGTPQPEQATSGINSLITTPGSQPTGVTLYDHYNMAGQFWAAYGLQCSDMTSLIGNNVAGMVFDMAKSLDRVTITVYQSAAGSNILSWLSSSVVNLIKALGNAIYFPFLAPVVIIGAIWLAWQGLIRKRATRTIEGTIWMVLACAFAIWLIGQPQDFTDVGTTVSNGVTSVLNTAFANLPTDATTGVGSNCLPIQQNDPDSVTANYAFTSGSGLVDQNANELWSVLVCKPWLVGEFGTSQYAPLGSAAANTNVVNEYGRSLLFAQAVASNETSSPALTQEKQAVYNGIAMRLQTQDPAVYSLFQGDQWTTRLEIGFTALFAAVAAGLLVLLIALTLIILKLGFLLLLVAGPFFLIVGVHPGFGRVVAIRWFEMLVGVLLKQVAVALVLSVLLYCYSLIMSTTDQELPWALKIMMISLVTVAVFIYRKPFQHLFSSVGYGMLGANERAETSWRESAFGFRRVSATAAGTIMPGAAAARASRWARRTATDGTGAADGTGTGAAEGVRATSTDGMSGGPTVDSHTAARHWPAAGVGTGRTAPPLPLPTNGTPPTANGGSAGWARGGGGAGGGSRGPTQPPARTTGPMPAAPTPPRATPSAPRQSGAPRPTATRTASTPPAPTQSTPAPAPPFWSRSRRRPQ